MTCFNKQYSAIQLRRGLDAEFVSSNIILASGEPAFAVDTNILKIGDGITDWSNLPTPSVSGATFYSATSPTDFDTAVSGVVMTILNQLNLLRY